MPDGSRISLRGSDADASTREKFCGNAGENAHEISPGGSVIRLRHTEDYQRTGTIASLPALLDDVYIEIFLHTGDWGLGETSTMVVLAANKCPHQHSNVD